MSHVLQFYTTDTINNSLNNKVSNVQKIWVALFTMMNHLKLITEHEQPVPHTYLQDHELTLDTNGRWRREMLPSDK